MLREVFQVSNQFGSLICNQHDNKVLVVTFYKPCGAGLSLGHELNIDTNAFLRAEVMERVLSPLETCHLSHFDELGAHDHIVK